MTAQPIVRKQRITRELILDCARELLRTNGVKSVSIRRIAEVIPCAPPSIYYYFRNKQAIIEALMVEPIEQLMLTLKEQQGSSNDPLEFVMAYASHWLERPDQLRLLLLPTAGVAESILSSSHYTQIELRLALLLGGDEMKAEALLGAVNGMLLKLLQHPQGVNAGSVARIRAYMLSLLGGGF